MTATRGSLFAVREPVQRVLALVAIVRLRPFDTSTAEGRANERYRRAALTALANAAARLVVVAVTLVSIPMILNYVGEEQYGVWATISAFTAMLAFADFGLGNGLLAAISAAHGAEDRGLAVRYVSSAFFMLCGVALALGAVFAILYPLVPWRSVFNVSVPAGSLVGPSLAVFVGCFVLSLPLATAQRVQYGYQEGFATSIWVACGSLLGLVGLAVGIARGATLPWLVLAMAGGPVVGLMFNWLVLFVRERPWLRPRLAAADRVLARRLLRIGLLFFVLQMAVAIAYQSDVVVATVVIGPNAAAQYSVTYRLFMFAPALISLALTPLWPAYTEAIGRGDIPWVRRALKLSVLATLAASALVSALIVWLADPILRAWVGSSLHVPSGLVLGMAIWAVISSSFNAMAMLFNGAVVIRFQVVVALTMAAASIAASIVLANRMGVAGIIWGTVGAYVICSAIPQIIYMPRLFQRLSQTDGGVARLAMPTGTATGSQP